MVPTVPGELIFAGGFTKFGWFSALAMVIEIRRPQRSRYLMSLSRPKSRLRIGGPARILKPELPNLPTGAGLAHTGLAAGAPGTAEGVWSHPGADRTAGERM